MLKLTLNNDKMIFTYTGCFIWKVEISNGCSSLTVHIWPYVGRAKKWLKGGRFFEKRNLVDAIIFERSKWKSAGGSQTHERRSNGKLTPCLCHKQTVRDLRTYKMGTTAILAFLAFVTLTQATMNMGNLWFTQNSGSNFEAESRPLPLSRIETLMESLEPNTNMKAIGRGVGKDVLYLKPWWGDFSKWRRSIRFKRNSGTLKMCVLKIGYKSSI